MGSGSQPDKEQEDGVQQDLSCEFIARNTKSEVYWHGQDRWQVPEYTDELPEIYSDEEPQRFFDVCDAVQELRRGRGSPQIADDHSLGAKSKNFLI